MISKTVLSGDWKGEKHVPFIQAPDTIAAGENFEVTVHIGEEIGHPNTLEHYIAWMKLYFQPEGGKFPIEVGTFTFAAHGEETVFTEPKIVTTMKTDKPGTFHALSYCNIHGLWENSLDVTLG